MLPFRLRALWDGLCEFGAILPIVLLVSFLWLLALIGLARLGLGIPLREQGVIELFCSLDGWAGKSLFFAMAVILASVVEELVFRGGLYRALKFNLDRRSATILSSAIFALMHFNLVSLLPLYVFGALLVKNYERFGNIAVPIIIHAAFNFNSLLIVTLHAL
jgi:membrane protease YdiL (CAAX protease family)